MWRRVDLVWTHVSEERIASIFRVEKSASEEPEWAGGCSHTRSARRHIPEDDILQIKSSPFVSRVNSLQISDVSGGHLSPPSHFDDVKDDPWNVDYF
jgi:hypothetical protein